MYYNLKSGKRAAKRPSDDCFATINRIKWGPLSPNDVGRFAQQVRKERNKKRMGRFSIETIVTPDEH